MLRLVLIAIAGSVAGCADDSVSRLVAIVQDGSVEEVRQALRELGEIGPEARETRETIARVLTSSEDPESRRLAAAALAKIGEASPATIDRLEASLSDPQFSVRMAAAFALQQLAPESTAYRDVIEEAIRQGEGGTIVALRQWEPPPVWAVPTLIERLERDRRPGIRRLSAETLGVIAHQAPEVQAALKKATSDPDDRVREAARQALTENSGDAPQ